MPVVDEIAFLSPPIPLTRMALALVSNAASQLASWMAKKQGESRVTTLATATIATLVLLHLWDQTANRKKTKGIPGSGGLPWIGETLFYATSPRDFAEERFNKYGEIWLTNIIFTNVVFVTGREILDFVFANPEIFPNDMFAPLAEILEGFPGVQYGAEHRANRTLVLQTLTDRNLKNRLGTMVEQFEKHINNWALQDKTEIYTSTELIIVHFMIRMLMHVEDASEEMLKEFAHLFGEYGKAVFGLPIDLGNWSIRGRAFKARRRIQGFIEDIVVKRRAENIRKDDSLQLLIDYMDKETGQPRDCHYISNVAFVLFLAAIDTSTSLICSTVTELCKDSQARAKVVEECRSVWGSKTLSALSNDELHEGLRKLTYTDAAVREALRLNAPVGSTFRRVTQDCQIPGTDHVFPKGWMVALCLDRTGRLNSNFKDCETFIPERWLPGGDAEKHSNFRGDIIPFVKGIHMCPGRDFAITEAKVMVSLLALRDRWPEVVRWPSAYLDKPAKYARDGMELKVF